MKTKYKILAFVPFVGMAMNSCCHKHSATIDNIFIGDINITDIKTGKTKTFIPPQKNVKNLEYLQIGDTVEVYTYFYDDYDKKTCFFPSDLFNIKMNKDSIKARAERKELQISYPKHFIKQKQR